MLCVEPQMVFHESSYKEIAMVISLVLSVGEWKSGRFASDLKELWLQLLSEKLISTSLIDQKR